MWRWCDAWRWLGVTTAWAVICCGVGTVASAQMPTPPAQAPAAPEPAHASPEPARPATDAAANPPAKPATAAQGYAAAAALQNDRQYAAAVIQWQAFLEQFPTAAQAEQARFHLGVCQLNAGQYQPASETLAALVDERPKFAQREMACYCLGVARYSAAMQGEVAPQARKRLLTESRQTLAALVADYPESERLAEALYYQAEAAYALAEPGEAAALYAELLTRFETHPRRGEALYGLGMCHQEQRDQQAAVDTYAKFLDEVPEHRLATEVRMRRGEALLALGRLAEAEQLLAMAAKQAGFSLADYATLYWAAALQKQLKHAEAAECYERFVTNFPKSQHRRSALLAGSQAAYQAADDERACRLLTVLLDEWPVAESGVVAPGQAEALYWFARSAARQQEPRTVIARLEPTLAQQVPSLWRGRLWFQLAEALRGVPSRQRDAVVVYAKVAELDTAEASESDRELVPRAMYLAALVSLGSKEYVDAEQWAGRFANRYADHALAEDATRVAAEALLALGEADLQAQRLPEAQRHLEQLLAQAPQSPVVDRARYRLAEVLVARGERVAASEQYERLLSELPESSLAPQAMLSLAQLKLLLADEAALARAEAVLDRLLAEHPASSAAERGRYLRALVHQRRGRVAQAIADLQAYLKAEEKLGPTAVAEAQWALAACHSASGELEAAEAIHRRLLTMKQDAVAQERILYELAWTLRSLDRAEESRAVFKQLTTDHPESPLTAETFYYLGDQDFEAADYDAAVASLQQARKLAGRSEVGAAATYKLALAYYQQKEYETAREALESLRKDHPQAELIAPATLMLGECWLRLAKLPEAQAAYQEVVERFPESEHAASAAARLKALAPQVSREP